MALVFFVVHTMDTQWRARHDVLERGNRSNLVWTTPTALTLSQYHCTENTIGSIYFSKHLSDVSQINLTRTRRRLCRVNNIRTDKKTSTRNNEDKIYK